jgi:hypothetical protein
LYLAGDSVGYAGTTWVAAAACTGQVPSPGAYWTPAPVLLGPEPPATSAAEGVIELAGDLGGTAASPQVTGTHLASALPVAQGGTGQGTQQAAIDALTGTQSAGKVVRSDGTHATLSAVQAGDVPVLNQNTTGTSAGLSATLGIASGGTGQVTAAAALSALGGAALAGAAFTGEVTVQPPASASDAATKAYVDATVQGLAVKASVQEATTAALPANIYGNGASGVGATLTAVVPGVLTVDGQAVALGDRVLVQNEVTSANNGIYLATTAGATGVAYVLTRSTDMNTASEVPGAFCFTENGTVNAGAGFTVASAGPFTVGTTAITWTQFSGAGEITAGTGLAKSGNTVSLVTPVTIPNGGTGQASKSAAFNALSPNAALGDITYGSGTNTSTNLAGNTSAAKSYLTQTGTGSVSAAPAWGAIAAADLPAATTSAQGAVQLDGTASDLKAPAVTAAAGTSTKAPAADHVHPLQDPLQLGMAQTFLPGMFMSAIAPTANAGWYVRLLSGGYAFSNIQLSVAVSSGNISVAAYTASGSGSSAKPATQLQTSGSIACPGVGTTSVALGGSCTPNLTDWLALGCDNNTATVQGGSGAIAGIVAGCVYQQTGLAGALLPAPAGTLTNSNQRMPFLRGQ